MAHTPNSSDPGTGGGGGGGGGGPSRTITGTEGNDVIVGTAGPNIINALGGNDDITGGAAFDTITGGTGDDVFRYRRAGEAPPGEEPGTEGQETITDFGNGADVVDLTAIAGFGSFTGTTPTLESVFAVQQGADTWLVADTDGITDTYEFVVVLQNVSAGSLNQDDVLV